VIRKNSQNLLIDFLNDVKCVYRWMCTVFIIHLAVFILIQKLMFPCRVPLTLRLLMSYIYIWITYSWCF
jgi:hypothetical protein